MPARAVPRADRRPWSGCGRLGSLDVSADHVSCDCCHLQACRAGLVTAGHCGRVGGRTSGAAVDAALPWFSPFADADSGGTPSWSHRLSFLQPSSLLLLFSILRRTSCVIFLPLCPSPPVSNSSISAFVLSHHLFPILPISPSHPTLLNSPWRPFFLFRLKKCTIFKGYFPFTVITEYWLCSPCCTYILEPVLHPVVCTSSLPT